MREKRCRTRLRTAEDSTASQVAGQGLCWEPVTRLERRKSRLAVAWPSSSEHCLWIKCE